jgi:Ca-activated chloride channel family protein
MFHFQHVEYLLALAAIPFMVLSYFLIIRWKKKIVRKIGEPQLVKQLVREYSPRLFTFKFVLIVISFALCALAVAGLVKPEGSQKINRTGIDVMIALDVSNSMLADDVKPNRLERAKQIVSKIIDRLSDNRIGIVIFAGRAYVQMPMTTDHSAAKMYLSAISPDDIPAQGTVISQALKTSYAAFAVKEKKYRSIILITDGEDHDEEAIKITRQLAEDGIMVNTVGIGSPQGAPIKDNKTNDYKRDENGAIVISRLNEEVLKSIAQNGNGLYQLFNTADLVASNIQKQLSGLGQTTLTDTAFAVYKNYFWYFLIAALLILTIEFLIPEKKKFTHQTTKKSSAVVGVMLLLFNVSFAQQGVNKAIKNGNEAYKKDQFETAATSYQKALNKAPDNNIALYNLGNALYKTDKPEDAVKLYENSIKSSPEKAVKAKGYYNKKVESGACRL